MFDETENVYVCTPVSAHMRARVCAYSELVTLITSAHDVVTITKQVSGVHCVSDDSLSG